MSRVVYCLMQELDSTIITHLAGNQHNIHSYTSWSSNVAHKLIACAHTHTRERHALERIPISRDVHAVVHWWGVLYLNDLYIYDLQNSIVRYICSACRYIFTVLWMWLMCVCVCVDDEGLAWSHAAWIYLLCISDANSKNVTNAYKYYKRSRFAS